MATRAPQAIDLGDASDEDAYQPGVCNIGPDEIARRRRSGHRGALVSVGLFVFLVAIDAPPPTRLLVALPAMGAASGYLQARLRFCAGFGSRGIYNLGALGSTQQVSDPEARSRDRAMAFRIGAASFAIGAAIGVAAALLRV